MALRYPKPTHARVVAVQLWEEAELLPRPRGIFFSAIVQSAWLVSISLGICLLSAITLSADEKQHNVVCRDSLLAQHRADLAVKLRRITGWPDLYFDSLGILRTGARAPVGGSKSARDLVMSVIFGRNVVVLEDASRSSAVAFSQVIPGRWKRAPPDNPPAFVVQIDFADFEHVLGDERALQAFDVGWAVLHEFDHIVNDSKDATSLDETGECESHINQMRRECNLPQRADYFFTFLPLAKDSAFITRLVRLAFDQEQKTANKRKRYWLVWDANVVGGMYEQKQVASMR
ncbi:MAG: hypothetical protein ACREBG_20375 [Pyrinomonadaceae bacterium]